MRSLIFRRRFAPHDPAPSIWSYRFQRLWLTPVFRQLLRMGVPTFALVAGIGWFLSDPAQVQRITDTAAELRREIEARPEFQVNVMGIDGASPQLAEAIRTTLSLDLPVSSFDLDLEEMRGRIEEIAAVRRAELRIRSGGYLAVRVEERVPALIWQSREGVVLLDAEGEYVADLADRVLPHPLPMAAGDGVDRAVPEALALIAAAEPLGPRMRGLVRMGERRWDVVLSDTRRILLPETGARDALDRVIALDEAQDVLARDVIRVDMRNPARPALQLTPHALTELRRMRELDPQNGDRNG